MEHFRQVINNLDWHEDGKFKATIINGIITELHFCEPGTDETDTTGKCLTSVNYKFLKAIHENLGELFTFMEAEGKRQGYSFSDKVEAKRGEEDEAVWISPSLS